MGMIIFRIVGPLVIFGLQFLLYRKTVRWLKSSQTEHHNLVRAVTALFILFNGAAAYMMINRPLMLDLPEWFLYSGVYPYFIWHGATFFIGLVVLLVSLIKLPFFALLSATKGIQFISQKRLQLQTKPAFQQFDATRRRFLRNGMYGLTAVSFGGSAYGMFVEPRDGEITSAEFFLPSLDPDLDGFTIGLISDIHSSVHMPKDKMNEYVTLLNSLQTDLIVVDGDFVNSAVEEVYPFAEAFSNLRAPHGVYGVMGNHDYYNNNPDLVAREVNDCGVTILLDDKVVIERNGVRFYLIGVDDISRGTSASVRMKKALGYAPEGIPKILLCHRPYFLQEAAELGIDLVLSGHTHGGQVVLGRFGETVLAPASLVSRYVWGKYEEGGSQMYVSRGVGTVGVPVRINCPPELTRIVLRAGKRSPVAQVTKPD